MVEALSEIGGPLVFLGLRLIKGEPSQRPPCWQLRKSRDQGQEFTSISLALPGEHDAWVWQATCSSSIYN